MARKADAESTAKTPRRKAKEFSLAPSDGERAGVRGDGGRLPRPSALLDTRVVYCGDNLEQLGRMQKEKGRMMNPAQFPILHSSFILLPSPVPASHYVKVMLDPELATL